MPYQRIMTPPYAEDLLGEIIKHMKTDNSKTKKFKQDYEKGVFSSLGKRAADEKNFQGIIDKEGVINLRVGGYDEL